MEFWGFAISHSSRVTLIQTLYLQLLMQGVPPEELEESGIPPELIMEAIQIIEQQMAAEDQQAAPAPEMGGGLAQQSVGTV